MSLILWYKLEDLTDSSGNNNHLTYLENNGKIVKVDYGKIEGCYERTVLNTNNDFLRSTNKIYLPDSFTMCCWAYVTSVHSDTANGLVTNHDHATSKGAGITVRDISSTDFRISCNSGDGVDRTYNHFYGTTNIKDKWSHLVVRYDKMNSLLSLWTNGNKEFEISYNMVCAEDYLDLFNWSTVYYTSANYRPACKIDDVRIYDHALSTKEIKELSKGKVLHFSFDDYQEPTLNLFGSRDNPYFQLNTMAGWGISHATGGTATVQDNNNYETGKCVTVKPATAGDQYYSFSTDNLGNMEGRKFTLSAVIECTQLTGYVKLHLYWVDAGGSWIWVSYGDIDCCTNTTPLKRYSITLTAPASARKAVILMATTVKDGLGTFSFGDIQVEEKNYATPFNRNIRYGIVTDSSGYDNHADLSYPMPITIESSSGVEILNGNEVAKISGTQAWDSGATSKQKFYGDCFVEWSVDSKTGYYNAEMVGLSNNHNTWNFTDINYAIYTYYNTHAYIYELGNQIEDKGEGAWTTGDSDKFRIEILYNTVRYYVNDILLHISQITPSYPYQVDMSLHCHGGRNIVKNIQAGYMPNRTTNPQYISPGKIGQGCYKFKNNLICLNKHLVILDNITMSAWINPSNYTPGGSYADRSIIIAKSYSYYMALTTDGKLSTYFYGVSGISDWTDGISIIPTNSWTHVAVTYDRSNIRWYINGILDKTLAATGAITDSMNNTTHVGGESVTFGRLFDGLIDDARLYVTALSPDDIKELYLNKASIDNGGNLYTKDVKEFDNIVEKINQAIIDKTLVNGLSYYSQSNCQITLMNNGYRIYRPPNLVYPTCGNTVWGGLRAYFFDANPNALIKNHTYRISFHIKGQSTNAPNVYFTNNMGWDGGGLNPEYAAIEFNTIPVNFQGEMDFYMIFKVTGDIFKKCTSAYGSFVVGNYYNSFIHFAIQYGYESTGVLGTDVYITDLRLEDITSTYITENTGGYIKNNSLTNNGVFTSSSFSELGVTEKLFAYYPLNNDTYDYATSLDSLALYDDYSSMLWNPWVKDLKCYKLDGENYLNNTSFANLGNNVSHTVSCWFRTTTTHEAPVGLVGLGYMPILMMKPDGVCYLWYYNTNHDDYRKIESRSRCNDGLWHNITYTYNYANKCVKLYIDGWLETKYDEPIGLESIHTSLDIGFEKNNGIRPFIGDICEIRIYKKELSDYEIKINYDLYNEKSFHSITSCYPFILNANEIQNRNPLTLYGSPTITDDGIEFKGIATSYATNTSFTMGANPYFTISGWFKRLGDITSGGTWGLGGDGANAGISNYTPHSNKISIDLWAQSTYYSNTEYPLNEWVHVVWIKRTPSFDTTSIEIYVNGVMQTLLVQRNNSSSTNLAAGLTLGKISPNTQDYFGAMRIKNFYVFNRAITPAEISELYNNNLYNNTNMKKTINDLYIKNQVISTL